MLRDPWDSLAVVGRLRQPLLWLHGSEDQITPVDLGEKLYAAVPGPKQQMVIKGAGHCDFLDQPEVLRRLLAFLAQVPRRLTARTAAQP
jgi:pimeloyl-ACP methyl ester carboxylesterase